MKTSSQRILDTGNQIAVQRPINNVPSNYFNLSHDVKASLEFGQLVPVCQVEVLPGDNFHIRSEALLRLQALISPVMHRINLRSEWFFVPYRLLWPNWEQFISPAQQDFDVPELPYIPAGQYTPEAGDIDDYLGLPVGIENAQINALFHAAYQRIYGDWYMDEDLSTNSAGDEFAYYVDLVDGNCEGLIPYLRQLHIRNYDRDYFTSAKPTTQQGPAVVIPNNYVGTTVPVSGTADAYIVAGDGSNIVPVASSLGNAEELDTSGDISSFVMDGEGGLRNVNVNVDGGDFYIDGDTLSAMGGTIEQLRQAVALQKFLEADLRGGTRYIELILNHFGVRSSDARLQRAEYIGSTLQPIVISEVLNNTGTPTAPQGALAGHGISVAPPNSPMHYYAEEHGVIMCLMSVMPATGYYQGIHRSMLRQFRLDFAWPEFAHLGEQAIQNQEIYYGNDEYDEQTFGYVPIYSEYRMLPNRVSGTFKTSLDYWHLARKFSSLPALNGDFIQCDYDANSLNRVFATLDDTGHILAHWFHQITVYRKLPRYVMPSI